MDKLCEQPGSSVMMRGVVSTRRFCTACSNKKNLERQTIARKNGGYGKKQHTPNSYCHFGEHYHYREGAGRYHRCEKHEQQARRLGLL